MADVVRGTLLSCMDEATLQYVVYLNSTGLQGADGKPEKFILREIDATHLFVKEDFVSEILEKMDEFSDSNAFTLSTNADGGTVKRRKAT